MRFTGLTLCTGHSAMTTGVVAQFGVAMMPLCCSTSAPLISGTTSGTSGSMRQAPVLSMTTAPAFTALGEYSFEVSSGMALKTMSQPWKLSCVRASTSSSCSPKRILLPAERGEARSFSDRSGNERLTRMPSSSCPTIPVAPTTATL